MSTECPEKAKCFPSPVVASRKVANVAIVQDGQQAPPTADDPIVELTRALNRAKALPDDQREEFAANFKDIVGGLDF